MEFLWKEFSSSTPKVKLLIWMVTELKAQSRPVTGASWSKGCSILSSLAYKMKASGSLKMEEKRESARVPN
jgi:hypothetical protein